MKTTKKTITRRLIEYDNGLWRAESRNGRLYMRGHVTIYNMIIYIVTEDVEKFYTIRNEDVWKTDADLYDIMRKRVCADGVFEDGSCDINSLAVPLKTSEKWIEIDITDNSQLKPTDMEMRAEAKKLYNEVARWQEDI